MPIFEENTGFALDLAVEDKFEDEKAWRIEDLQTEEQKS